jgi:hypothetical protein
LLPLLMLIVLVQLHVQLHVLVLMLMLLLLLLVLVAAPISGCDAAASDCFCFNKLTGFLQVKYARIF